MGWNEPEYTERFIDASDVEIKLTSEQVIGHPEVWWAWVSCDDSVYEYDSKAGNVNAALFALIKDLYVDLINGRIEAEAKALELCILKEKLAGIKGGKKEKEDGGTL